MVLTVRRQRRNKNIINNWQYVSGFDVSFESLYFCKRKNLKNKRRGTSNFAVNFTVVPLQAFLRPIFGKDMERYVQGASKVIR